jgi:hypothetical protein
MAVSAAMVESVLTMVVSATRRVSISVSVETRVLSSLASSLREPPQAANPICSSMTPGEIRMVAPGLKVPGKLQPPGPDDAVRKITSTTEPARGA